MKCLIINGPKHFKPKLTVAGLSLANGGVNSNLEVYLIEEFNIERISAAKIFNVVNGFLSILPLAAAIIADSFSTWYSVIWISTLISPLGLLLLTLTAAFSKLRPPPCENGSPELCQMPAGVQLAVLYLGLGLISLGLAGTRFTIGSMGAYQFDKSKHQGISFNWFIFFMYTSFLVSSTAIVYVEDDMSWAWGFGICFAANTIGLLLFSAGTGFYRQMKPLRSPFASLARVVVAAIRKKSVQHSENPRDYCQDHDDKTLTSYKILQALTMDRHLGHKFEIPAGTMPVFIFLSTCITIFLVDRFLFRMWNTFLAGAITSSCWNWRRVPFPGHISFCYQEFPKYMKNTSTAVVSLFIGIGFYWGNGLIDLVRRSTDWLPDDIKKGRLDNVYWIVTALGGINFCYFHLCSWLYKYRNGENESLNGSILYIYVFKTRPEGEPLA
ncbi:OLC1v1004033C1 [Oldenlandia corymbosa var. corymbosa]|uniref:OLC1v1004033C1 n=1 Tax=Oldenlandia corymbosa var. corymbosa TaxID=529605 RepID=A0AAV1DD79_OLDCO|nr:OLC1v1004033C1 [Oldenlandia corymbosa var. corymbosa]